MSAEESTVLCPACHAGVDVTGCFPGAEVVCRCGRSCTVPGASPPRATPAPDPYRMAEAPTEARMLKCPFCGAPCPSEARACPHCDVELATVRCPHCFALHFAGSRFCARCGRELELEPLLDPSDAPCPRCDRPLSFMGGPPVDETLGSFPMHECRGCGGIFVTHKVLDAIVARERPAPRTSLSGVAGHPPPVSAPADVVRYLKCPLCHGIMNRVNFGKRSGVIVDVCKGDGVWFDRGELTAAVEFVVQGGLEEAPALPDGSEARKETAKMKAAMMAESLREASADAYKAGRFEGVLSGGHHSTLLDILYELLR